MRRRAHAGASAAASPPPPVKLEFPAAAPPPAKRVKLEHEGAAAASSPAPPAAPVPPDVKPVPPPDVKPRLPKLEDEEDEDAAGVPPFVPPPLVFVPPPFVFVPPPPPPRPRYGAGLGSNRQERKFNFYMGVPDYPPDVLCGPPPPASFCDIEIHKAPSFKVAFKHGMKPTPPQLQVMETEAAALMSGRREHVIVEAPTGTGKTIACLTPLLHYQAQQFELYGVIDPARPPRIIYVARTLSQLDNTMKEIASMPYAALIAAPVSKEHLCLQPREEGMSAADLCTKMCKPLSARDQEEMPERRKGAKAQDVLRVP